MYFVPKKGIDYPKMLDLYIKDLLNKAYRPNAHLLYIVMHYNGNII